VDIGTANSDPLFVVERTDIVTVYMKVPDTFAPYVSEGTEALITMNNLPGVEIHGKGPGLINRWKPATPI
jgi:hypothetical protein